MILSPSNCYVKMSPHEGDGDIEQERTEDVDGIESRRYHSLQILSTLDSSQSWDKESQKEAPTKAPQPQGTLP